MPSAGRRLRGGAPLLAGRGGNLPPMSQRVSWIARVAALVLAGAAASAGQTRSPADLDAMIARGERLAAADHLDDAAAIASQVLAVRPESGRRHYLLRGVHQRHRNSGAAAARYPPRRPP